MPNLHRLFIASLALSIAALAGCGQPESERNDQAPTLSLTGLTDSLVARVPQPRQDPFEIRPFNPDIADDRSGMAVAYGCYRAGQAPGQKGPSETEILEDLRIIADHWGLIRVYSAGDDTERILRVIRANNIPVKMILGVWLATEQDNPDQRNNNVSQVVGGIRLAREYSDIVVAISVGNETQVYWSGHRTAPETLVRYIRATRSNVAVPVTTADDYNFWNKPESKAVAEEIDFIVTHMHPLWNGKTLENAIAWQDGVYRELTQLHPGHLVVLGETGWATDYNADKTGPGQQGTLVKGEASVAAQGDYLIQLHHWVDSTGVITFLFEAFDEPWKGGGEDSPPNEIEKHWGVYYEDRTPKESFRTYLSYLRPDQE